MGRLASCVLLLATSAAWGQPSSQGAEPTVEDLGGGRYQIGAILLDQDKKSFTVSGRVLRIEPPLEYLAVTVGGAKGYESLLELDADALEFNLACILIGLTTDDVVPPDYQFDLDEIVGPSVRIIAAWGAGNDRVEVDAGQLLVDGDGAGSAGDWVYFGSTYVPGNERPFAASNAGTLIGLVHDPASIIDHRTGIGIGRYGSIGGNAALLTAVGMQLTLRIETGDAAEADAPSSD
jgi:hypothetical protein